MEKRIKQKKIWIAAAGVVLLAALIAVAAALKGGKEPAYRSIKIVELEGDVSIERGGVGTLAAAENMNLVSGDRVATAEKAYVVLCLDTDKYVMLGEAGAMKVVAEGDGSSGKTSISLEGGSVLSDIRNPLGEGSSYEIATPNATMSVRGTVFEVKKEKEDGGQVSVLVYDGSVAVGLGGKEPVLYGAGEYTVFTGDAVPEVLVERGTVSDEVLDEKVRERLQQISTEGRTLNVGSVDLSVAAQTGSAPTAAPEVKPTSAPTTVPEVTEATPEPAAVPEVTAAPVPTPVPEATATPVPTAMPEVTVTPEPTAMPEVTATPAPTPVPMVTTPVPVPAVTPEPVAPPAVTEAPVPEPDEGEEPEEDDEDEDEEEEPAATPTKEPERAPQPTWQPTPLPEGYCRISYEIPYVLLSGKEPSNSGEAEGILPALDYASSSVKKGEKIWKQGEAEVTSIPNHEDVKSLGFEFVGWYQESGNPWNYDTDVMEADTVLYPVWKDKEGNLYKVRVSRELGICYSIKDGTAASPSPAPSSSPSPAPSEEPAASPSPAPSSSPSPAPSEEPVASPSPAPSSEPAES